jgi:hypothetical protein
MKARHPAASPMSAAAANFFRRDMGIGLGLLISGWFTD